VTKFKICSHPFHSQQSLLIILCRKSLCFKNAGANLCLSIGLQVLGIQLRKTTNMQTVLGRLISTNFTFRNLHVDTNSVLLHLNFVNVLQIKYGHEVAKLSCNGSRWFTISPEIRFIVRHRAYALKPLNRIRSKSVKETQPEH
jgi:hypothetical protein